MSLIMVKNRSEEKEEESPTYKNKCSNIVLQNAQNHSKKKKRTRGIKLLDPIGKKS